MERQEFLKSLGLGIVAVCAGSCLSACGGKGDTGTPNSNPGTGGGGGITTGNTVSVDFTNSLANVGDQTKVNGVLFFRIATGNTTSSFVATEALCPHQSGSLIWLNTQNKIQCQLHQAEYTASGSVTQGPQGSSGNTRTLKIYSTSITGNMITATVV